MRRTKQAIADLGANNLDAARKNIGIALYTLQDFYSHSDVLIGNPKTYSFPVDDRVSRLNISVALVNNTGIIMVQRPDGSIVQAGNARVQQITISNARIFAIDVPKAGEWTTH